MLESNLYTAIACIAGNWYAFAYNSTEVYSIGRDSPKDGGLWFAKNTDSGIMYVASPSPSRNAAYQKAKRHGTYCGEW